MSADLLLRTSTPASPSPADARAEAATEPTDGLWHTVDVQPFTRESVDRLLRHEVPAVRLASFATPAESQAFADAMLGGARRTGSIAQVARLGISQYQQGVRGSKAAYFAAADEARAEYAAIFAASFNPVQRFIAALEGVGYAAEVEEEPGHGRYFAGTGKLRNGHTPMHVDFSPQDSTGWRVGALQAQLAWNLYLQVPPEGGELLLWERLWQPEDDAWLEPGQYYHRPEVVADARELRLPAVPGEVLILNSRCYHAVSDSENRLAYGSFVAWYGDNRLGLFS